MQIAYPHETTAWILAPTSNRAEAPCSLLRENQTRSVICWPRLVFSFFAPRVEHALLPLKSREGTEPPFGFHRRRAYVMASQKYSEENRRRDQSRRAGLSRSIDRAFGTFYFSGQLAKDIPLLELKIGLHRLLPQIDG